MKAIMRTKTAPCIQPLDLDLVHRIGAGEVIDSLAAVVRELVDNALDAGATRIGVNLWPQDWRVQVSDNGTGLSPLDLEQAAAPHTTSKLRACADLSRIQTLGFRGEALHSLAQVGQLEMRSRPLGADAGWWARYDDRGHLIHMDRVAIAPGTVVTVDQLFAHWPARQQALPPVHQQLRAAQAVIYQQALCHPLVTWQVWQGDRPWFNIAPAATAQEILPQILATLRPGELQRISRTLPPPHTQNALELVIGLPDRCHRSRPDWVRVAVNGRCVQVSCDPALGSRSPRPLEQTILGAFRHTLPRHRYPLCFVHLQVDPTQVDWNRHPAKTDIYLQHLEFWRQQLAQAIQQALQLAGGPSALSAASKTQQILKVAESSGTYQLQSASDLTSELEHREAVHTPPAPSGFNQLRAIAQLHQTYIVAEHSTGLWLVEQHIAHERVLYEQLCQDWQLINITPPQMLRDLSEAQVEKLQEIGLEVDAFGPQVWAVRSAPQALASRSDCEAALLELSQCADIEAALVATACRSAIRNGTPLDMAEMQTLLIQWQQTRHPRTCPHGRPIYLALEESQLARFFRRHWVIGKSHGI
jgi:DNA mismatch repair protein MutL